MEYCDKCGKEMTDSSSESGSALIGVAVQFTTSKEFGRAFAQKQLGKYELNKKYQFCWECLLDSLFGRH